MKYGVSLSRGLVGFFFICSGLVKLNDPLGFSFKLEEYFSTGVLNLPYLTPYTLGIALFIVISEVLLGITLLLGFKRRVTLWSLLIMMLFFTFLTFYSAYFNKVTDCGCFGDVVKITPWQSFYKDVVLLILIVFVFLKKQHIHALFPKKSGAIIMIVTLSGCIFFAYHVLNHLPVFDFRPYKTGIDIKEGMTIPDDAPEPVYEYVWKFMVGGKEKKITTLGSYPQINGKFIDVKTTEIQKGYQPPIQDFTIERNGEDYAPMILEEDHVIMILFYDLDEFSEEGLKKVKKVIANAQKRGYQVIGLSPATSEQAAQFKHMHDIPINFYFTDQTTVKTMIRSNPGIIKLKKGTILQKLHYNDAKLLNLDDKT